MELLHYWASLDATKTMLSNLVAESLRSAGIAESPLAPSSGSAASSSSMSPKAPQAARKEILRSPHSNSTDAPQRKLAPLRDGSVDGSEPAEFVISVADEPREDTASMSLALDDVLGNTVASLGGTLNADDSSPRRALNPQKRSGNMLTTMHPKSPRSTTSSSSSFSDRLTAAPYHIVDEVDAAHARGALSPRSISPALQLNQDMVGSVPAAVEPGQLSHEALASLRRSPNPLMSEASSGSLNNTPRRPEGDAPCRPSRSPSPAGSKLLEELAASCNSRASSSHGMMGARSLPAAPAPEKPQKYASYQDVPRFYFAEGKPQTQSATLIGPHSNRHENPHLTIFEGVAIPLGAQQQLLMQLGGGGEGNGTPQGPKLSPMLPLAVMEDEDVFPFVQREFARLPAPPPKQQVQPAKQTKGAVLRRPTTSATAPSKQEQAYRQALLATMHRVCTQAFGLPRYFTALVMRKLQSDAEGLSSDEGHPLPLSSNGGRPGTSSGASSSSASSGSGVITVSQVKEFYEKYLRFRSIVRRMFEVLIVTSKVPHITTGGGAEGGRRNYLVRDDFSIYLDTLLETHPGLAFLRQTTDFQGKYSETVVYRIFYELDRMDRGRISWPEFENSKLPDAFRQVDATDDINTVLNYFSYEHFYVLYCRFWELDEDRDMQISQQDLLKYAPDGTMNPKIAERIFQGYGRKLSCKTRGKMNYEDFVWFCLSEEDKGTPRAIRYWFRLLDLDGDGVLCGYELETFYAHTKKQLLQMTTEGISFADVVCQISDMLPFSLKQGIRLGDMLAAPQSAFVALNMILNVLKFLQFEQRDPFVAHHDRLVGGFERNDWDRFARQEYDRMAQQADGD